MSTLDRRLFAYCPPARVRLHAAVAAGFAATALLMGQAVLLSQVVAGVFLEDAGLSDVTPAILAMLALAAGRAALLAASEVLAQQSAGRLKTGLREAFMSHLSTLGPAFIRGERTGELVHTATQGLDDIDEYVTAYMPARYLAALVPVLVGLFVLFIDPLSVAVLLLTGPLLVLFLVLIGSRAKEITDKRYRDLSLLSASFLDLLQGLPTLKMFGRSKEQVANIQAASRQYGSTTLSVLRTAFETTFVLELSATVATALVAVEVGLRLAHGSMAFQPALAVLIITPEFFLPVKQLSLRYHARAAGQTAGEAILGLLDTPPMPRAAAALSASPPNAGLRFDHVSFAYAEGRVALNDVSFEIPRGTQLAIMGPTGAGKSTVASLLLRFIEPQSGSIRAGGEQLGVMDEAGWRRRVAWVPQRPHLFYGTVAQNIRLARPDATWREVAEAARTAGAHGFIQGLPSGYDTMLGEEGVGLSGGELQRLALARAFLKDAPFLILDEPTSHLDTASEAQVSAAIERLARGRTVLLISHRRRLVERADQVVLLEAGRVVAQGTPRDVLSRRATAAVAA